MYWSTLSCFGLRSCSVWSQVLCMLVTWAIAVHQPVSYLKKTYNTVLWTNGQQLPEWPACEAPVVPTACHTPSKFVGSDSARQPPSRLFGQPIQYHKRLRVRFGWDDHQFPVLHKWQPFSAPLTFIKKLTVIWHSFICASQKLILNYLHFPNDFL